MKAYVTISTGDIFGPEGSYTEQNQYLVNSNEEDILDTFYLISKVVTHVDPVVVRNKVEVFLDLIVNDTLADVTSKKDAIKNGQSWPANSDSLELVIGVDSDDDTVDVELVNPGMIQHKRIEDIMNVIIGHYGYFD